MFPCLFRWSVMVWVSLLSFSFQSSFPFQCNGRDMQALLDFKEGLNSSGLLNWNTTLDYCKWVGVECGSTSGNKTAVTKLELQEKGLKGTISSSLGCLPNLKELNLSYNLLFGEPPCEVFLLQYVEIVDLSFNNLTGPYPVPIGRGLPSIKSLNISSNELRGELPNLGSAPNLIAFNVSNNSFTAHIPTNICKNWSSIQILDFSTNQFNGSLSEGLADCEALEEFNAGSNNLVGPLPCDLYSIPSLRQLSLPSNGFTGQLDSRIQNLSNITNLVLNDNILSGPLPEELGKLEKLEQLILGNNMFNASLPSLSSCKKLQVLNLKRNIFTGNISLDFTNFPDLVSLDLAGNKLTGSIPATISKCKLVRTINLGANYLHGEIPQDLRYLKALLFISLSINTLENVSSALHVLQHCRNLTTVILSKNFQGGVIPSDISGFKVLRVLALGNCGLRGPFANWLQHCHYLQVLDLSWNRFTGSIPPWLGNFTFLFYLDLANNSFSGEIPVNLAQLVSLTTGQNLTAEDKTSLESPLFIKHNQNASGLQYNQLSSFPPAIYLSRNNLSGSIWPQFGRMKFIHILDLSNNNLAGTIPDTLSNMSNLESLDLSNNNLIGSIPSSLKQLTFLAKFNVAHNHLEGPIPFGGQFSTFPETSFEGNFGLCGFPLGNCNSTNTTHPMPKSESSRVHNRLQRNTILGTIVFFGIEISFLLAAIRWGLSQRRIQINERQNKTGCRRPGRLYQYTESPLAILSQNSYKKTLTLADFLKATSNFDEANIIGSGSSGLVYKATLEDGTEFAVKRSSEVSLEMDWKFKAKVEALSKAQHPNLVCLEGYCIYGNNRLLIYCYLENGSLDYWLHEKPDGRPLLDWKTRIRIAQGAGRGLAYLQSIAEPYMVHGDIKSTNILLDDELQAHISDFSLSSLNSMHDTEESTEHRGRLGYIPSEHGQPWIATLRSDVYNFGVVILELLTGKRAVDVSKQNGCEDLVSWVQRMRSDNQQEFMFDSLLLGKGYTEQLLQLLNLALLCTNQNPLQRPTMSQVMSWLESIVAHSQQTN